MSNFNSSSVSAVSSINTTKGAQTMKTSTTDYMIQNYAKAFGIEYRQVTIAPITKLRKAQLDAEHREYMYETYGNRYTEVRRPFMYNGRLVKSVQEFPHVAAKPAGNTCGVQREKQTGVCAGNGGTAVTTKVKGGRTSLDYKSIKSPRIEIPCKAYKVYQPNRSERINRNGGSFNGNLMFNPTVKYTQAYRSEAFPLMAEDSIRLYMAYDQMFDNIPVAVQVDMTFDNLRADICARATKARKTERRAVNRIAFTLDNILSLLGRGGNLCRRSKGFCPNFVAEVFSNVSVYANHAIAVRNAENLAKEFMAKAKLNFPVELQMDLKTEAKMTNLEVTAELLLEDYTTVGIAKELGVTESTVQKYTAELIGNGTLTLIDVFGDDANETFEYMSHLDYTHMGLKEMAIAIYQEAFESVDAETKSYIYYMLNCCKAALVGAPVNKEYSKGSTTKAGSKAVTSTTKNKVTSKTTAKAGDISSYKKGILTMLNNGKTFSQIVAVKKNALAVSECIAELVVDGQIDPFELGLISEAQYAAIAKVYTAKATFTQMLTKLKWPTTGVKAAKNFMVARVAVAVLKSDDKKTTDSSKKKGVSTAVESKTDSRKSMTKQSSVTKPTTPKEETMSLGKITNPESLSNLIDVLSTTEGLTPLFSLYNAEHTEEDSEHIVVAITRGLPNYEAEDGEVIAANNNIIGKVDEKHKWLMELEVVVDKDQPDSYFPHINSNKTMYMNSSPVGCDAGSIRTHRYTIANAANGKTKRVASAHPDWDKLAYTNFKLDKRTLKAGVQIMFESFVENKPDHTIKSGIPGKNNTVPNNVAAIRSYIKNGIVSGEDISILEAHGNYVEVYKTLEEVYETETGVIRDEFTYEGNEYAGGETESQFFLVVGKVSNAQFHPYSTFGGNGDEFKKDGQIRIRTSRMLCYHIDAAQIENIVDMSQAIEDHEFFKFMAQPATEAHKQIKIKQEENAKAIAEANKFEAAKRLALKSPKKTAVAVEDKEEEVTPAASIAVADKEPKAVKKTVASPKELNAVEKPPAMSPKKTKAVTQALSKSFEELEVLRAQLDKGVLKNAERNDFWTPAEILACLSPLAMSEKKAEVLRYLYNDESAIEALLTGERCNANYLTADAVRLYLYGHMSNKGKDNVCPETLGVISSYAWQLSDVEDIITIIHGMMVGKKSRSLLNKGNRKITNAIRMEKDNDRHTIYIDDTAMFFIDENNIVYDSRERAFSNTVELFPIIEDKKLISVDTACASSLGNFIRFIFFGYLPLITHWTGNQAVYANTLPNLKSMLNNGDMFCMTADKVFEQNGGAQHALLSTYQAVSYPDISPLVFQKDKKKCRIWGKATADGARALNRKYNTTLGRYNGELGHLYADMIAMAQASAHAEYGLDFHFTKSAFIAGPLGHINMEMIKQHCPNLFAELTAVLGEYDTAMVIALTIKASKGLKRVMLSLAQATGVENPAIAGWSLPGMDQLMEGALVKVAFAPTLVGAPGISAWVGNEEDMPVGVTNKRIGYQVNTFDATKINDCPFDFSYSTVSDLMVATSEVTVEDGWNVMTFTSPVHLKGTGDEILCSVNQKAGELPKYVWHETKLEGQLSNLRWKFSGAIDNKNTDLEIEYTVVMKERHLKLRSIAKAQYVKINDKFVNHGLNTGVMNADLIHLQDGIKSDTIYSWLMVIANTIFNLIKNGSTDQDILDMYAMYKDCNRTVNHVEEVDGVEILHIEPIGVVLGIYTPLIAKWEQKFGRAVWYDWQDAGVQGRMMWDIYSALAETGKWVDGDDAIAGLQFEAKERQSYVCLREAGEVTDKTNILYFLFEGETVVRYWQRAYTFVGTEETPMYNVELLESSTVKESISSSQSLAAYVKALRLVARPEDQEIVKSVQKELMSDAQDSIYKAKYLAAASLGLTLDKQVVKLGESSNDEGYSFVTMSKKDKEDIKELLESKDIFIDLGKAGDKHFFKKLCAALADKVFIYTKSTGEGEDSVTTKSSFWLPALYNFSRMSSNSEDNRSFVSTFVNNVLLPLINGAKVATIEMSKTIGMMESVMSSENTIKLTNARRNAGGKRITLPCIPCGETWVLYSEDTNSMYQEMLRAGIAVDQAMMGETILVLNNRAPMPLGAITRVRVIRSFEGVQYRYTFKHEDKRLASAPLFYEMSPTQVGVSAMDVYLDGGDFDGDNHYCTLVSNKLEGSITTYETTRTLRSNALGKYDMFSAEASDKGVYAADHYGIKSFTKAAKTLSENLLNSIKKDAIKKASDYVEYNKQAYIIQNKVVGVAYGLYMWGEILSELANMLEVAGKTVPKSLQIFLGEKGKTLVLTLAEIYEVMLGGYDENVWAWWSHPTVGLFNISTGCAMSTSPANISCLGQLIDSMKADGSRAAEIAQVMNLAAQIFLAQKKDGYFTKGKDADAGLETYLGLTLAAFELGRGKFNGFNGILRDNPNAGDEDGKVKNKRAAAHKHAVKLAFDYINSMPNEEYQVLHKESVTLQSMVNISNLMQAEILGRKKDIEWIDEDFEFFLKDLDITSTPVDTSEDIDDSDDQDNSDDSNDEPDNDPTPDTEPDSDGEVADESTKEEEESIQTAAIAAKPTPKPVVTKQEVIKHEVAKPVVTKPVVEPKTQVKEEVEETLPSDLNDLIKQVTGDKLDRLRAYVEQLIKEDKEVAVAKTAAPPCFAEGLAKLQAEEQESTETTEEESEGETLQEPGDEEEPGDVDFLAGGYDETEEEPPLSMSLKAVKVEKKAVKSEALNITPQKTPSPKVVSTTKDKVKQTPASSVKGGAAKKSMVFTSTLEKRTDISTAYEAFLDAANRIKKNLSESDKSEAQRLISTLTDEQQNVARGVLIGEHVCLTGEGGAGKSFTVEQIRALYDLLGLAYFVTGSTGTSVMNVKGHATFNSLCGVGIGFQVRYKAKENGKGFIPLPTSERDYNMLRNKATGNPNITGRFNSALRQNKGIPVLIIVDEISMVDTLLLTCANEIITQCGSAVQWLFVGDPLQLLPVKGNLFFKDPILHDEEGTVVEVRDSILKDLNFSTYNLTQNLRAKGDVEYVAAMNRMRLGKGIHKIIYQRVEESAGQLPEEAVHIFFNNSEVRNYNRIKTEEAIKAGADYRVYKAKTVKTNTQDDYWYMKKDKNNRPTDDCRFDPIEPEMKLCVGMPVMLRVIIKNGAGEVLAGNGSTGTITALGTTGVTVKFDHGKVLTISPQQLEGGPTNDKGKPLGIYEQLPLHPAYAMTIHKVQGLTITRDLIIHVYELIRGEKVAFSKKTPNLLYVGCSRVTKRENLWFDLMGQSVHEFKSHLRSSFHTDKEALEWVEAIQ